MAGEKGFTLWFTGLSGAGKTTIARLLCDRRRREGHPILLLDGDSLRSIFADRDGYGRAERLRLKAEDDRERAEAALSFEALVDEWAQLHLAHRRKRYREEAQRAIKHTFADLLKRPAARIARGEIINVLDNLVRSTKAVTAARSLAYARAAFNWAAKREKVAQNPFVGLPVAAVAADRERVLTDAELADVWAAIETMGYRGVHSSASRS